MNEGIEDQVRGVRRRLKVVRVVHLGLLLVLLFGKELGLVPSEVVLWAMGVIAGLMVAEGVVFDWKGGLR